MKKTIATFLLVCLLIPVLLFTVNTTERFWNIMFPKQVAQASTVRTAPYSSNFLQNYFYNLRSNLSENHSTCGYVAIGMLLSYYDTFWDDDIVPEAYETTAVISSLSDNDYNSPGAGETYHNLENCGYSAPYIYDHLIYSHSNDVLQGKLLEIAYLLRNYLNFEYDEQGALIINELMPQQAETITNQFLLENRPNGSSTDKLYTSSNYTDLSILSAEQRSTTSLNTRERIISHVEDNIPVAVFYGKSDKSWGHVAIAYDYDPVNDMLYFHNGYRGNSSFKSETQLGLDHSITHENYYYGDLTFFLIGGHVHSNNFVLDSGSAVCSCQLSDHTHMYSYSLFNESNHKKSCHCGYSTTEGHSYRYENLKYVCRYCNKIYSGGTPPITPALPVANNSGNSEWLGIDVINMEVPTYEA